MNRRINSAQVRLRWMVAIMTVAALPLVKAHEIVWSCSRAEPEPEAFDRLRPYRVENLSTKDTGGIVIALSDLYGAYGGQKIQMGPHVLAVCTLPAHDPLQIEAMDMLGYSPQDVEQALRSPESKLVLVPSIQRMQKCMVENHPAIGFFQTTVENERIGPCF
jgi:hypothetical protein